jgi:tetraacyldisaccharide 4'-kinase
MSSRIRFLLFPFSWLYGAGAFLFHALYDLGIKKSVAFEIPVIGIGNLTAGGAGKTPMVEYVAGLLGKSFVAGVLSRGYKRSTKGYVEVDHDSPARKVGDEPVQIKKKIPFPPRGCV